MRRFFILSMILAMNLLGAAPVLAVLFTAHAAVLEVQPDEQIMVNIVIDTESETINTVSGRIVFPLDLLETQEILLEDSLVDLWVDQPASYLITGNGNDYGEIPFSGVLLEGYNGSEGAVFSVVFKAKKEGTALVEIENAQALLNDGSGTQAAVTVEGAEISIAVEEETEENEELEEAQEEEAAQTSSNTDQASNTDTSESGTSGASTIPTSSSSTSTNLIEAEPQEDSTPVITPEAQVEMTQYTQEQQMVKEQKIVTRNFSKPARKCEFIVMNSTAAGWNIDTTKTVSEHFDDINEAGFTWCAAAADYAFERGIIKGRSSREFGVTGYITRFEVAVIIARQLNPFLDNETETEFVDNEDIVPWARGGVAYLKERGIFRGFNLGDGTFRFGGDKDILKIDAAVILYRAFMQ